MPGAADDDERQPVSRWYARYAGALNHTVLNTDRAELAGRLREQEVANMDAMEEAEVMEAEIAHLRRYVQPVVEKLREARDDDMRELEATLAQIRREDKRPVESRDSQGPSHDDEAEQDLPIRSLTPLVSPEREQVSSDGLSVEYTLDDFQRLSRNLAQVQRESGDKDRRLRSLKRDLDQERARGNGIQVNLNGLLQDVTALRNTKLQYEQLQAEHTVLEKRNEVLAQEVSELKRSGGGIGVVDALRDDVDVLEREIERVRTQRKTAITEREKAEDLLDDEIRKVRRLTRDLEAAKNTVEEKDRALSLANKGAEEREKQAASSEWKRLYHDQVEKLDALKTERDLLSKEKGEEKELHVYWEKKYNEVVGTPHPDAESWKGKYEAIVREAWETKCKTALSELAKLQARHEEEKTGRQNAEKQAGEELETLRHQVGLGSEISCKAYDDVGQILAGLDPSYQANPAEKLSIRLVTDRLDHLATAVKDVSEAKADAEKRIDSGEKVLRNWLEDGTEETRLRREQLGLEQILAELDEVLLIGQGNFLKTSHDAFMNIYRILGCIKGIEDPVFDQAGFQKWMEAREDDIRDIRNKWIAMHQTEREGVGRSMVDDLGLKSCLDELDQRDGALSSLRDAMVKYHERVEGKLEAWDTSYAALAQEMRRKVSFWKGKSEELEGLVRSMSEASL